MFKYAADKSIKAQTQDTLIPTPANILSFHKLVC